MIQIDAPLAAIFITILLALIATGVAWGSLRERVNHNSKDIGDKAEAQEKIVSQIRAEFKAYQLNNREDHSMIFNKLDKIFMQNDKRD